MLEAPRELLDRALLPLEPPDPNALEPRELLPLDALRPPMLSRLLPPLERLLTLGLLPRLPEDRSLTPGLPPRLPEPPEDRLLALGMFPP